MNLEKFNSIKNNFLKEKGKYESLLKSKEEKEKKLNKLKDNSITYDKARLLLLKTAEYQRLQVKKDMEDLVTKALQYIREEDISFFIDKKEVRGRIEYDFKIITNRNGIKTVTDVMESRGDGVSDIVALALDIAMIELSGVSGPIILDEPAKQVSKNYINNIGEFLKDLSIAFDRQIIMITHNKDLMYVGDNKINVVLEGTETKVFCNDKMPITNHL